MKTRSIVTLAVALALGTGAVALTRSWIAARIAAPLPRQDEIVKQKIVVAAAQLHFGSRIGPEHVREVEWGTPVLPGGAFASVEELLQDKNRVVLQAIAPDEPILASKVSGPGQRASLSALIDPDMRALSIRVNDVLGVAGFVLPNDRVDIMLTREVAKDDFVTDVLLQNVKVLAVDQTADNQRDSPLVVKSVTLEINTEQAQKLTLAAKVGSMSLALRGVTDVSAQSVRRVGERDLAGTEIVMPAPTPAVLPAVAAPPPQRRRPVAKAPAPTGAVVGVTRATTRHEYRVQIERPTPATSPRVDTQPLMAPVRANPVPLLPPAAPVAPVKASRIIGCVASCSGEFHG